MKNLRAVCLAFTLFFFGRQVEAAGPTTIGTVTTIPAQDATPAGVVTVSNVNAIEISGRVTGGSGVLILLRKTYTQTGATPHFQFRPWFEDRPIDPYATSTAGGYFSARYHIPINTTGEYFVIYNPSGTVTLDGATALVARGINY